MSIGKKLAIAAVVVASVTAYMAYLGASSSWQYYMTVQECVQNAPWVAGRRIRVSGTIVPGSLVVAADRQEARFTLGQADDRLSVVCTGPLPDDLSPEKPMEVVVEGRVEAGRAESPARLRGDKLITRCASKYNARKDETTIVANQSSGVTTR